MTTRGIKVRYWSPPVADMLHVMLLLDRPFFTPRMVPERPTIAFGDSITEDASSLAQTLSLLKQGASCFGSDKGPDAAPRVGFGRRTGRGRPNPHRDRGRRTEPHASWGVAVKQSG